MSRRRCALVVDDTEDVRELYAEYLAFCGYVVVTAVNGREAVDKAATCSPTVIVMDLAMPVLDGWEATRLLRTDGRFQSIPILVVSGNALPEQVQRAMSAGATAVLRKPCTPKELSIAMDLVIRGEPVPKDLCKH